MGDPTLSTITSMKAVDEWIATINGNMTGAGRTGYKASKVTFGGGTPQILRVPDSSKLPIQTPGESLNVSQTTLDFSQGVITASTQDTHLAISGSGFFMLTDSLDGSNDADGNLYYSRDGEFTLDSSGRYVNPQGLYLISAGSNSTNDADYTDAVDTKRFRAITSTNVSLFIAEANNSTAAPAADLALPDSPTTLTCATLVNFINPQALKYSQYGSTIFEVGKADSDGTVSAETSIMDSSLEASNSSLQILVPELSLAQKMFQALTKVLQVHHANLDSLINVIR